MLEQPEQAANEPQGENMISQNEAVTNNHAGNMTASSFSGPLSETLDLDQTVRADSTAFIEDEIDTGNEANVRVGHEQAARFTIVAKSPGPSDVVACGEMTISFSAMEVHCRGRLVVLTRKEFKTLAYLLKNARRVVSRDELLNEVWGYECYPCTRTVDNHILRLRKKLEREPARPRHFRTVHGTGYKFLP